jgi:hypothetical protein
LPDRFIGSGCSLTKGAPAYDGIHALLGLVSLFGIVASIFLFKGAKWARISIGIIAIGLGVGALFWENLPQGWIRADKWADDVTFILSLVTVVLLFFPRDAPIATQIATW